MEPAFTHLVQRHASSASSSQPSLDRASSLPSPLCPSLARVVELMARPPTGSELDARDPARARARRGHRGAPPGRLAAVSSSSVRRLVLSAVACGGVVERERAGRERELTTMSDGVAPTQGSSSWAWRTTQWPPRCPSSQRGQPLADQEGRRLVRVPRLLSPGPLPLSSGPLSGRTLAQDTADPDLDARRLPRRAMRAT